MSTLSPRAEPPESSLLWGAIGRAFALVFGVGVFVHTCLALLDTESYRPFADAALVDWVLREWQTVFMADPRLWALVLAISQLLIASLLLFARRIGYVGVIAFTLALMLFGWTFWWWGVPALALAIPAAVHEFHTTGHGLTL
jgi:hypothetical protein